MLKRVLVRTFGDQNHLGESGLLNSLATGWDLCIWRVRFIFSQNETSFRKEKNCKMVMSTISQSSTWRTRKLPRFFSSTKSTRISPSQPFGHFSPSFRPELGSSRHRGRSTSPKRNTQKATERLSRAGLESIGTISRFFLSLRIRMPARNDT